MTEREETSHELRDSKFAFMGKTFLAGGVSGMCAKTTIAPLDRLKILLQARNVHYRNHSVLQAFLAIRGKEGLLGYFKGNGAMMLRIFPYAAIQFMSYEQYKKFLRPYFRADRHTSKLVAGSWTGITAVTCTYPLDVVRARLAYQVYEARYRGVWHALRCIWMEEGGLRGLYRGYTPTIMGMIPYAGVAFYSYEVLKAFAIDNLTWATKLSLDGSGTVVLTIPANLLCGAVAGALAQTVSYPLDVVRRNLQVHGLAADPHHHSMRTLHILVDLYRRLGLVKGIFRGLSLNYYRAMPQVAVSFSVYELMKQLLQISKPHH